MPELPEVETVCRGLSQAVIGDVIDDIYISGKPLRHPYPTDLEFSIKGSEILSVTRRAKYILMRLSGNQILIVHLGMSGKLTVSQDIAERGKHDHVILTLRSGREIVFNDARRFGCVVLHSGDGVEGHELFKNLGPEPFDVIVTPKWFLENLKSKSQHIKLTLMDQAFLVGVGNIYASEALFRAGIKPTRPSNKITLKEAVKLIESIKSVLEDAIKSGGSTLRDYVRSTGEAGYFQHSFDVYDRDKKPCKICASDIVKVVQGGRSSYFCENCQK